MMIVIDVIFIKKEIIFKVLGNIRFLFFVLKGNFFVVIINILVIVKIDIKKVLVVRIEYWNMLILILLDFFLLNNSISIVSENLYSSVLMNWIWLVSLFMYLKESFIIFNLGFSYLYDNFLKVYFVKSIKYYIV